MKIFNYIILVCFCFLKAQSSQRDYNEELRYQNDAINKMKKEIEEFNAMREKKMSDKEDEIKTFKKDVKSAQKDYSKAQSVLQKHTMQIEQFESDKQELATQLEEQKENLNN